MNSTFQEDLLDINDLQITYSYATFWFRFWARVIDGLILAVLTPLISYNRTDWGNSTLLIAISCILVAYKPFFEYVYGATPGKLLLHLRVVNYRYGKASFEQIFLRNIFHISSGLISSVIGLFNIHQLPLLHISHGITSIAFNPGLFQMAFFLIYLADLVFFLSSANNRSLHDRIGKTFVIKEK